MKYWVIKPSSPSDGAYLSGLSSAMPKAQKFRKGISLINNYPATEDCKIYYDPQYPEGTYLYEVLDNITDFLIINGDVRKVFEDMGEDGIEYLPIWLCDHKHEISSKDYTICNVLNKVDIVDMDKSEYEMDDFDEDQIYGFSKLVVDYEAIPEGAKMFRASKKLDQIFINDDVKQALEKAGIEGYVVKEADGWNGR